VAKRLAALPRKQQPSAGWDFSFLSDGEPWLLVRGVDFEPEVTLASVRRRVREWARRAGYGLERGYVLETRTVLKHPQRAWIPASSKPSRSGPRDAAKYAVGTQST
jgi:hypothetical protein